MRRKTINKKDGRLPSETRIRLVGDILKERLWGEVRRRLDYRSVVLYYAIYGRCNLSELRLFDHCSQILKDVSYLLYISEHQYVS